VSEPRVIYALRPDTTPWPITIALAAIYGRAIERFEEDKKGGPETALDEDEGNSDDFASTKNLSK
jgi:hypothetical protein